MYHLLTVNETAKILGLKPSTIRKKIFQKTFPHVRIDGAVRIKLEDIQDIIQKGYNPVKQY